jgi:hypothetical protein
MKNNNIVDTKEAVNSIVKLAFAAIPFGQYFIEALDYRGRVKQGRLNQFTTLLAEYMENIDGSVDVTIMKTDEFGDLLESVIKKVVTTDSTAKHQRFKNILINQISNNQVNDYTETFLDLIEKLNDLQIQILSKHIEIPGSFEDLFAQRDAIQNELFAEEEKLKKEKDAFDKGYANKYSIVLNQVEEVKINFESIQSDIEHYMQYNNCSSYNESAGNFQFAIQDLASKALLVDVGVGRIGTGPFEITDITQFGREFLNYIRLN